MSTKLSVKRGSEGPAHDPYGYTEITVLRDGDEVTLHRPGFDGWVKQASALIEQCHGWVQSAPVIALTQLRFDNVDDPARAQLIPFDMWTRMMQWLKEQLDVAGVCLYGHDFDIPGEPARPEDKDGTRRRDWRLAERHVLTARDSIVGRKKRKAE